MTNSFGQLIKLIRQEKVSLFIGSGFSLEAGAPTVSKLCSAIFENFDNDEQRLSHQNDSLSTLANYYVEELHTGSRSSLVEILQEQFTYDVQSMEDHKKLALVPHFHTIFTTNYDTHLEDSYEKDLVSVVRNDRDCCYASNTPVSIYKIHGDFTNPESIVITSDDYNKFIESPSNPIMWAKVLIEFAQKHILFIGYSLEDDNILRIIRKVSQSVGKDQKEMYLIAPKLKEEKQNELKKMKVKYYNNYATEFLDVLLAELCQNISDDYKKKWISEETFSRFVRTRDIIPASESGKKSNRILGVRPVEGKTLEGKLNFTVSKESNEIIREMDFEKYGTIVNDSTFKNIPCIKLTGDQLQKANYSVNGIVMYNKIETILVGPSRNPFSTTVSIPGRSFLEKLSGYCFKLNKNKNQFVFDCDIYDLTIITEKHPTDKNRIGLNFNFQFKETYIDNDKALKWIDFVVALFAGEEIKFPELSIVYDRSNLASSDTSLPFKSMKRYYENIRDIESLHGAKFTEYNGYTPELYDISERIRAFLRHKPIVVESPERELYEINLRYCPEEFKKNRYPEEVSIVTSLNDNKSLILNGAKFFFPYTHNIFNSCVITTYQEDKNGAQSIKFRTTENHYLLLYSKNPVEVEFPKLHPLR